MTAVVLVAVFGAGALLGFAADSSLEAEPPTPVAESVETDGAEAVEESEPRRTPMYRKVEPNEDQLERIDAIVVEHRARTNALDEETRAEFRAGFRVILLETRESIKGVLSAGQAAEYQHLLDEWDARPAADRENDDRN